MLEELSSNFRKGRPAMPSAKRVAAKKWIQDAIKRPGRVREYLGIPEGEEIPRAKLNAAISKLEKSGANPSLLAALNLAKTLKTKVAATAEAANIRVAFNKENPPDLFSGLVKVLSREGLKDEANRVRQISKAILTAWARKDDKKAGM